MKPIIFHDADPVLAVKQAEAISGHGQKWVREVCRKYRIAQQVDRNSSIRIHAPAFRMVIHGDFETLERLRSGDRSDPDVIQYFEISRR
ncbi:hypothetical protein [Brucella microti]|uniref:hypothetical protein n=1 Tax=Brucella microti TaxID=444163 RepID=UPI0011D1041B|nr:hypothetical protein [Brucella microti]